VIGTTTTVVVGGRKGVVGRVVVVVLVVVDHVGLTPFSVGRSTSQAVTATAIKPSPVRVTINLRNADSSLGYVNEHSVRQVYYSIKFTKSPHYFKQLWYNNASYERRYLR
jgi:hypothetical protein